MHVPLGYYTSQSDACAPGLPPNSLSLNGTWKFSLVKNPQVCYYQIYICVKAVCIMQP
jgi:hypothetical protein